MSLKKQWLLSIVIVIFTATWLAGHEWTPKPFDSTTVGLQSGGAGLVAPAGVTASPTTSAVASPDVTDHPLPTTRLLPTVHPATTGPHAFIRTNPDGTPVTWSPCAPIHYSVNSDEMPANGAQVLRAAIDRVSAATGLKFIQDEGTHAKPSEFGLPDDVPPGSEWGYVPVLIAWATEKEFSPLKGDVAGVASPIPFPAASSSVKPQHMLQYVSGQVVLDAEYYRAIAAQGLTTWEEATLMHELGHLVGLAHVHVATELMNEDNVGLLQFGPGDLQGLAEAGSGRCTF
jgi:hypothetical protein